MKILFIYIALIFIILIACKESTEPEENNSEVPQPIAYFPFNGNANDESGHGYNGTVVGATITNDRFGNTNSAYIFDGIDDYIYRVYSDTCEIFPTNNPFSVSVWFKTAVSSPVEPKILSTHYAGVGHDGYWVGIENNSGSILRWSFNAGTQGNDVYSINAVNDGQWHHVVGTRTNYKIYMYLDGELQSSGATIDYGAVPYEYKPQFRIGHSHNTGGSLDSEYYFNGSIDDIRIYNCLLSDEAIQDLYHEGGWKQ